ncbi:cytochrome P450 [Stipitochalara longipes BDJ]|nr:cytochrome P450 [Stipitochalara longipes BDJ]
MTAFFPSSAVYAQLLNLLPIIAVVYLLFILAVIFQRVFFHPLAKYPGPLFARITDWYTVYHCVIGDRHLDLYKLHSIYGPIVRIGPSRISLNTNTALREVYHVNANVQKSAVYSSYKHFFEVPMSMVMTDKRKHAFRRRINVRALSETAVKSMEPLMIKYIRLMCQQIFENKKNSTDGWSSPKDMSKLVSYVMADIMGEMVFSKNWNVLESAENRDIVDFLPEAVGGLILTGHMQGLLKFDLYKLVARTLVNNVYRFKDLTAAQSTWRIAHHDEIKGKDLFASLLEAKDPETGLGFTHEELISEAGLFIITGSDTMGTGVASTIFYLLHNPDCLVRLQEEIRNAFHDVEDIRIGPTLSACHFLFACLTEAMRFSPPAGACMPREVMKGGIHVDGEWFPEGIDVSVPVYSLHHHEEYFPDSFSYRPDRWIAGSPGVTEADVERAQSAYHPFSVGRASCVGRHLAYQQMAITLARIVWLYDMRQAPGSKVGEGNLKLGELRKRKDEFQTWDRFVSVHEGPIVQFRRRTVV